MWPSHPKPALDAPVTRAESRRAHRAARRRTNPRGAQSDVGGRHDGYAAWRERNRAGHDAPGIDNAPVLPPRPPAQRA